MPAGTLAGLRTGVLGRIMVSPGIESCRIPKTDAEILRFFLCFLADQGPPLPALHAVSGGESSARAEGLSDVPVFINGGYAMASKLEPPLGSQEMPREF